MLERSLPPTVLAKLVEGGVMLAGLAAIVFAPKVIPALATASSPALDKIKQWVGGTVKFPEQRSQLMHIFANRPGHVLDTPANRKMIQRVANNKRNFLGINRDGNEVFAQIMQDGSQVWAYVRDGVIRNGGRNLASAIKTWIDGYGLK